MAKHPRLIVPTLKEGDPNEGDQKEGDLKGGWLMTLKFGRPISKLRGKMSRTHGDFARFMQPIRQNRDLMRGYATLCTKRGRPSETLVNGPAHW